MSDLSVLGLIDTTISIFNLISGLIPNSSGPSSVLRMGVGHNVNGGLQDAGGHVPWVSAYSVDWKNVGNYNPNSRSCVSNGFSTVCVDNYATIKNGDYKDLKLAQTSGTQPLYIEMNMVKNDGICLAYLTHTWPDGHKYGWLGDWAKQCKQDW